MKSKITIGILVFEEAEELDFVGPYEVFGMAAEFGEPCRAVVIAETDAAVRCAHGLRVLPDCTIENAPHLDLLIVPGGRGARLHARNNPKILEFVRQQKGRRRFRLHRRDGPRGRRRFRRNGSDDPLRTL